MNRTLIAVKRIQTVLHKSRPLSVGSKFAGHVEHSAKKRGGKMHRMMIFIHEKFQVIRQHSLVKPYGILSTRQRRLQRCCGQEQNYVWVPIIPCLYPSDSQKHLIDGNLLVLVNKGQQIRAEKLAFFTMFKYITVCHSIYEIFLFIASARKKKRKKKSARQ